VLRLLVDRNLQENVSSADQDDPLPQDARHQSRPLLGVILYYTKGSRKQDEAHQLANDHRRIPGALGPCSFGRQEETDQATQDETQSRQIESEDQVSDCGLLDGLGRV
jgi:hypothetical protein